MPSQKKIETAKIYKAYLEKYSDFIFTEYKGLTVEEVTSFRKNIKDKSSKYVIIKNKVFEKALQEKNLNINNIIGPTGVLFSNDIVNAAKSIKDFIKEPSKKDKLSIKGGFCEGKIVDASYVLALADLPSKEEIISKLLGTLNNPISRFVRVINNPIQKLVFALKAIAEKKQ
ncbi:MAG TPA: 50S ribosomal protein L10 [Spirochaetota bacterium]|nr:50S ribosomal protein L10 [Spirochaetota bacterium]HOM38351.1 50S ribosomal protein L10 [Spirochaetota bacterium]HPQ48431.1 50S ribosomal protein L10 [Spirochaetota bacterium]